MKLLKRIAGFITYILVAAIVVNIAFTWELADKTMRLPTIIILVAIGFVFLVDLMIELKNAFKIGPVKMELAPNKIDFHPGEFIEGYVQLTVSKPISARALKVGLIAESEVRTDKRTKTITYCDVVEELEGEKEYTPSSAPVSYTFKIQIPPETLDKIQHGTEKIKEMAGQNKLVSLGLDYLNSKAIGEIEWRLYAILDVPMNLDVSREIILRVTP
ncbi:MAG: hypothetical protein HY544_03300 [Candidatus Diapherotrites archaeon]|uniref:Arrestin-like N-terminal domain-containing protein n=1 Tax=Candidatus Iainarchaeum sp. TaxID=3101447 RepID=A0A8T3YJ04_9ARCH|nr:hypothetical protein [Candidatus Diapherotrites archaeon]